jgi:hypothetical protein
MKAKEGKDPFSREGYEEMARYMYKIKPNGNSNTWGEIIFANMYYRMQMNSIGRSDNVEDLLFSHFDWAEDAYKYSHHKTLSCRSLLLPQVGRGGVGKHLLFVANLYLSLFVCEAHL